MAVVVPLSNRAELTADEKISLAQLRHFLGRYDKYMVAPRALRIAFDDFGVKRFDDAFFGSIVNHTRLILSSYFYEAFSDYRFILIYHLDALVFSDQLLQWCEADFDYIGPPWIKYDGAPYTGWPIENKVGNGGFALKKTASFLRVLAAARGFSRHARKMLDMREKDIPGYPPANSDMFWALNAPAHYPKFRIAPVETALRFGFECNPRLCFEMNNRQLPFGCHAWHRHDRAFWEQYLMK